MATHGHIHLWGNYSLCRNVSYLQVLARGHILTELHPAKKGSPGDQYMGISDSLVNQESRSRSILYLHIVQSWKNVSNLLTFKHQAQLSFELGLEFLARGAGVTN